MCRESPGASSGLLHFWRRPTPGNPSGEHCFSGLGGLVFPFSVSGEENTMQQVKCVLVGGTGKSAPPVVAALLRSWRKPS